MRFARLSGVVTSGESKKSGKNHGSDKHQISLKHLLAKGNYKGYFCTRNIFLAHVKLAVYKPPLNRIVTA